MKRNNFWKLLLILILIPLSLTHCGETDQMNDPAGENGTSPSPSVSFSSGGEEGIPPFRAGGHLLFDITHSGEGLYRFDLINKDTQQPQAFLARGVGPFDITVESEVPEADYELQVETEGGWSVSVYGDIQEYATPGTICTDYSADIHFNTCRNHGGYDQIKGCSESKGRIVCFDNYLSETTCDCDGGGV